MAKPIEFPAAAVSATADSVAATIAEAAQPGPVPTPGAGSSIDAAAATVAAAVARNVAASSAELTPKGPELLAKSQAAVAAMKARDAENAAKLKAVPEGMHANEAGRSGVQAASSTGDPWEDWANFSEGSFEPAPLGPAGAGPGPGVLPGGVPADLVSHSDGDWFTDDNWHDRNDVVDPGGAAAGPGAIGPVPAELVSFSGDDDWFYGDAPEPVLPTGPAGAGPGPSVIPGSGVPDKLL